MKNQERRLQQRIDRRKKKVERMIEEQKLKLTALDSVIYLRQEDYQQASALIRNRLCRLQQELRGLKAGKLRW